MLIVFGYAVILQTNLFVAHQGLEAVDIDVLLFGLWVLGLFAKSPRMNQWCHCDIKSAIRQLTDTVRLHVHGFKKGVRYDLFVAIDLANYRVRVEHAERMVKRLQTPLDVLVQILRTFVTDIVVSTKDIPLVMEILFLGLIRQ